MLQNNYCISLKTLQTFLCSTAIALLLGCAEDRLDVDVSGVQTEVNIDRWDSEWNDINPLRFRKLHERNLAENPLVYQHYVEDVLQLGAVDDSTLYTSVRAFVTHQDFQEVFDSVATHYESLGDVESQLSSAWKHYRYYFPDRTVPKHISCVGGFNAPFILTTEEVAICLEMFLGEDCKFYEYLQAPLYLRQRFTREHLSPWLIKGWIETEFQLATEADPTMLESIVHQGKLYYILDALLRDTPDHVKIGYTEQELEWAKAHERMVWAHFIDEELLFSANATEIAKFTNDGPFTVDLVKESPSRMGHFVGWQLVRSYMNQQDKIDLQALLDTSAEEILKNSKYKP